VGSGCPGMADHGLLVAATCVQHPTPLERVGQAVRLAEQGQPAPESLDPSLVEPRHVFLCVRNHALNYTALCVRTNSPSARDYGTGPSSRRNLWLVACQFLKRCRTPYFRVQGTDPSAFLHCMKAVRVEHKGEATGLWLRLDDLVLLPAILLRVF
jgi:hypothetical protein